MTHALNTDYENTQNPYGIIVCDTCGQTSTMQASADGSWEFVYGDHAKLEHVLCPTCYQRRPPHKEPIR